MSPKPLNLDHLTLVEEPTSLTFMKVGPHFYQDPALLGQEESKKEVEDGREEILPT